MSKNKFHVKCPHCEASLIVDSDTGDLLSSEAGKEKNLVSMEERFKEMEEKKERASEIFSQQMKAVKDKDRLLEEKFKEAMKRKDDLDDSRPLRDIDLD